MHGVATVHGEPSDSSLPSAPVVAVSETSLARHTPATSAGLGAIAGLAFGLPFAGMGAFMAGLPIGFAIGVASGTLFGGAMALFLTFMQRTMPDQMLAELPRGQTVLLHGPANHNRGGLDSVGGWMVLTDEQLWFRSHGFNLEEREVVIAPADISAVHPWNVAGIIRTSIVIDHEGGSDRFVVQQRSRWVAAIEELAVTTSSRPKR